MAKEKKCPYLRKSCIQHDCVLYIQIQGCHPQTGAQIDKWGCSHELTPLLLIENSALQRQTAAEISAFRSEMRKDNVALGSLLLKSGENGQDKSEPELIESGQKGA